MIRTVLFSVALSALLIFAVFRVVDIFRQVEPERVTRIDIHSDRITYRTNRYPTPSLLEIGLKAANDPPRVVGLHDCGRMADFGAIIDVLRDLGYTSFEVELPEDC